MNFSSPLQHIFFNQICRQYIFTHHVCGSAMSLPQTCKLSHQVTHYCLTTVRVQTFLQMSSTAATTHTHCNLHLLQL